MNVPNRPELSLACFCYTDFVARFATGRVVTRLPRGVLSLRFPLRSPCPYPSFETEDLRFTNEN